MSWSDPKQRRPAVQCILHRKMERLSFQVPGTDPSTAADKYDAPTCYSHRT